VGLGGVAEVDPFAVKQDGARVALVDACEDLHQGGLAGSIFADEPVYLAGMEFQCCVLEHGNAEEALGQSADFQNRAGFRPGTGSCR